MSTEIGSFSYNWDINGIISTSFDSDSPKSMGEETKYFGMSLPLLISGQLGVLSIKSGFHLIGPFLEACNSNNYKIYRIDRSLIKCEIKLNRTDDGIALLFYPQAEQTYSEEQIESDVVNFILNLTAYSNSNVPKDIFVRSKFFSMTTIKYYLDILVEGFTQKTIVTLDGGDPWLWPRMNIFWQNIEYHWEDVEIPNKRVRDLPRELLKSYGKLRKKLRIR